MLSKLIIVIISDGRKLFMMAKKLIRSASSFFLFLPYVRCSFGDICAIVRVNRAILTMGRSRK